MLTDMSHLSLLLNTTFGVTRLSQWFDSLYFCLNYFSPSPQIMRMECIQHLQKKRGSLRTGEHGQISPGILISLSNTCSMTYRHKTPLPNIKPTSITDEENVVNIQKEKKLWALL